MKRRILITGAGGMLGEAIVKTFEDDNLFITDKHDLDITNPEHIDKWVNRKLDLVLHLAAETDLEICEKDVVHAGITNRLGTKNMTYVATTNDCPIVYISTAGVFGGNGENMTFTENNHPIPANTYGYTKLQGEQEVKKYSKHWIFRSGWMMGGGPEKDHKFVNKIYKQIVEGKKIIHALKDVYGSPTYTWDLANTIKSCVDASIPYGLYHSAGTGRASRFDVAKEICAICAEWVTVKPVVGGFFKEQFPCKRAVSEVISNTRLDALKISKMNDWRSSLRKYLMRYYK